jgi:hypothetical protein
VRPVRKRAIAAGIGLAHHIAYAAERRAAGKRGMFTAPGDDAKLAWVRQFRHFLCALPTSEREACSRCMEWNQATKQFDITPGMPSYLPLLTTADVAPVSSEAAALPLHAHSASSSVASTDETHADADEYELASSFSSSLMASRANSSSPLVDPFCPSSASTDVAAASASSSSAHPHHSSHARHDVRVKVEHAEMCDDDLGTQPIGEEEERTWEREVDQPTSTIMQHDHHAIVHSAAEAEQEESADDFFVKFEAETDLLGMTPLTRDISLDTVTSMAAAASTISSEFDFDASSAHAASSPFAALSPLASPVPLTSDPSSWIPWSLESDPRGWLDTVNF